MKSFAHIRLYFRIVEGVRECVLSWCVCYWYYFSCVMQLFLLKGKENLARVFLLINKSEHRKLGSSRIKILRSCYVRNFLCTFFSSYTANNSKHFFIYFWTLKYIYIWKMDIALILNKQTLLTPHTDACIYVHICTQLIKSISIFLFSSLLRTQQLTCIYLYISM